MNYKGYLKMTHLLAGIILIGLIAWNFYFEEEFDPFREPYSSDDFTARQVDSVAVDDSQPANENNEAEEEPRPEIYGVSAVHPLAADVGMQIIEDGGNAIDAAVAVSFMLNVVEPYGSGIGGGGLMVYHDPQEGAMSFDYREKAPPSGNEAPLERGRSPAIPGLVKGMEFIYENYGSENVAWEDLITPAIDRAEEGVQAGEVFAQQTGNAVRYLLMDDYERDIFFPGGQAPEVNDLIVQEELANTLRLIQEDRADGFYSGEVGQSLQQQFNFTEEDLLGYEAQVTEPIQAEIGSQVVYGGPSPSSGTVVVQALQMAEQMDLSRVFEEEEDIPDHLTMGEMINHEELQAVYMHLVNEITRSAYSSRLSTLGDPEFENIDHQALTDEAFIQDLLNDINYGSHDYTDASELFDTPAEEADSRHTTHFVIVDKEGGMVSATHSLGEFFGSGIYTDGFFINNQMNNFSYNNPESPNYYQPGKRPRTFVSPVIFEEHGQPVLGLGSPGGTRIPAMVFQTIMSYQYGLNEDGERMSLQEAIETPRFYNDNDVIYIQDDDLPEETMQQLNELNYSVVPHSSPLYYGGIQGLGVVLDDEGRVQGMYGGGDPRRNGAWQIESE
ncbi:gamma-glutamyltransferase family protein [Salipaludibacillus aurantiacus]|uniref:Gamma-glutamyltranspeptidase / glutathione hydrolase n=1 Tax=Salipaludibacillus aurantiacus TaxID=1601833 RepID=A0A1H9X636_9BACI|nr:gamma-glutamyltransferase [Salipaludibacillus aurantiacus]SES41539.1 gamma-glutamyltranspeptidase / glutathione hydrolase [Salipaludibacillus aurantiacus]